ncbi:MAG: 16S rRNA (guanine(527)-N(7))-methyltransferase RsmG [Burkholderiaceae bacterium]|jgi:16S rRNA (guanine527-N7)-methyltransferase
MNRHHVEEVLSRMGLADLRSKIHILDRYLGLLSRWNKRINLTAIRDEPSMWTHHVLDCLAILPVLRKALVGQGKSPAPSILDAGTGAGLPALMLALAEPTWRIVAADAVDKKITFVRQAAAVMELASLRPVHARLEALKLGHDGVGLLPAEGFDVIVSRAFASLYDFVGHTQHLLHPMGFYCAMKGQVPEQEIEVFKASFKDWRLEVIPLDVPGLEARRCAVIMCPCPADDASPSRPNDCPN